MADFNYFPLRCFVLSLTFCACVVHAASTAIPIKEPKRKQPVDFAKEILPLLKKNCASCHNPAQPKAGLVLDSHASIMKGGNNGAVVVPDRPDESPLLTLAARQDDPVMPPQKNDVNAKPLKSEELGLIKMWIVQGAKGGDAVEATVVPHKWQALPVGFNPINTVAVTPDGTYAICGRANQIFVYSIPLGELVTRLTDPALIDAGVATHRGVAERDLVQALAMSPDGTLLASAGYRSVKLWRRPALEPRVTISPAAGPVRALATSPDGKWIATSGPENTIKLWNASTGQAARTITGHTAPVTALQFSNDNRRLCSGSADKSVRIWDAASGESFAKADTPAVVNAVTWLLNNSGLVSTGGADNIIRTWKLPEQANGEFRMGVEIKGHTGPITALATWPGNRDLIFSGSTDGLAQLWNALSGALVHRFDHGGPVTSVAVCLNGNVCATAGEANNVKLWNFNNKQMIKEIKGNHQARERAADAERNVTFAKQEVAYFKMTLENAEKQLKANTMTVTKNNEAKASAEKALAQKQDDFKKAKEAREVGEKTFVEPLAALKQAAEAKTVADAAVAAVTAESKTISQHASDVRVQLEKANLDLAVTEKAVGEITPKTKSFEAKALKQKVDEAQADVDKATAEKTVAEQAIAAVAAKMKTAGEAKVAAEKVNNETLNKHKDPDIKFKALQTAEENAHKALQVAEHAKVVADHNLEGSIAAVKSGEQAIIAAKAGMQNAEIGQKQAEAGYEAAKKAAVETEKPQRAVAFSPDKRSLATVGDDQIIQTWNASTGMPIEEFKKVGGSILCLDFLPNNTLVSGGGDENVIVWNGDIDWKLERTIGTGDDNSVLTGRVLALDFSSDGKLLATGGGRPSRTGEVKIWQVSNGELVRELKEPHSDTVYGVEFSPDDKYLASCGADKFLKVFEAGNGKLVKTFEGHTNHVLDVSWNQSGRRLITCGADRAVKAWHFATGEQTQPIPQLGRKEVTCVHYVGVSDTALCAVSEGFLRIIKDDASNNNVRDFNTNVPVIYIQSAAITSSGAIVVSGGNDSKLRVWNGANGQLINTFEPPASEAATVLHEQKPKK